MDVKRLLLLVKRLRFFIYLLEGRSGAHFGKIPKQVSGNLVQPVHLL